jgi:uncharacterized membrane protein
MVVPYSSRSAGRFRHFLHRAEQRARPVAQRMRQNLQAAPQLLARLGASEINID